jgi:phage terminase large subunit
MQSGLRWACLREVQKSLRLSVKQLIEDKIEAFGLESEFESKRDEIVTPGNGILIFQGMQDHTADSIKSLEGFDGALFEEAQSASQRSLDLLRPTIRKEESELWFAWNPLNDTDPVDVLLRGENPPPRSIVVESNYEDNPWFPDVLREEMEYDKRRDPDKYAHVWLGKYRKNSEARVFKNWKIEEFEVGHDWVRRQGADWGFSVDPSVLISCYLRGRTLFVDQEAYMVGCEIIDLPELFDGVTDSRKWFTTADSARPETISHMRKHWSQKINAAIKGPKSLDEGVEWLKSFDIVVHPRCKHLIDELSLYSYKVDPKTQQVLPELADKDNHIIDALRYACEGVRRAEVAEPAKVVALPIANRW